MKRLTKKAYSEAPEFMVAIDYLAGRGKEHGKKPWQTWQTEPLTARDILRAMNEAEEWMNSDVYMVHLLQKVSRDDCRVFYRAILANRKSGWHCHDNQHGEQNDFGFSVDMSDGSGFQYAEYEEID